ncbi:STAS domain protein [compost metagenome]
MNQIDATALGVLTHLEHSLSQRGIALLLAEVKGPVLDRLRHTAFGERMQGRVFLSTHDAFVFAQHSAVKRPSVVDRLSTSTL